MQWYLIVGCTFGFLSAIAGGIVDARLLSKHHQADGETGVGGPMLLLAGMINSLVGVISIVISLLVTGSLRLAFFLGLSVLIGFVTGFLLLAGLFIVRGK